MPKITLQIPNVLVRTDPDADPSGNQGSPPAPLVFDSPHSGLLFPEDFEPAIPIEQCERVADWFVDDLFGAAPRLGAVYLTALFRRAYIDPNRDKADLDLEMIDGVWPEPLAVTEKTARGASLIWRMIDGETPIYGRKLSVGEVRHRIETYWQPYHDTLKSALDHVHARHGRVVHINCHSMPEWEDARWESHREENRRGEDRRGENRREDRGERDGRKRRADFIIGTRDGTTAGEAVTEVVVESLRASGYSVAINDTFKGVELIRRYAAPSQGRESLQIEVNRGLYMDESALTRNERYGATQAAITRMIEALRRYVTAEAPPTA
jgi:N-formylglutamate amidohydrolase